MQLGLLIILFINNHSSLSQLKCLRSDAESGGPTAATRPGIFHFRLVANLGGAHSNFAQHSDEWRTANESHQARRLGCAFLLKPNLAVI